MPRLSIIIPVLGEPQGLDDTLVSVLENRPTNCEVLVVHNQPYQDPYNLSDEVRFVEAHRNDGLAKCLNLAAAESHSPVVHIVTCGVEATPGWTDAAMRHFHDPQIASVAAVVVDRQNRRLAVSAGWGYRMEGAAWHFGQGVFVDDLPSHRRDLRGPDTLAAFYRTSALEAVGGFSAWCGDALTAIDTALALRHAGFRNVLEPQCLAHIEPATISRESAFQHGLHAERLFWRWAAAHGMVASLVGHAALLAGQSVLGLWRPSMPLQMAGRLAGMLSAPFAPCRPKPPESVSTEMPAIVPAPHFALAANREPHPSSRVA